MLSIFKLQTLKQKLWAIVAASFVARVITFFTLPNTPSSLALDEETYAALTKWIGLSKPAENFPLFGEGLYLSGRALIIPASMLFRLGINELDAIRIASSLYGLLGLTIIAYFIQIMFKTVKENSESSKKQENLILCLIFVLAFMPSHFVWSVLGLRESANEFWLISTFICTYLLYRVVKRKRILVAVLLSFSILCTFSARPQVGWVLAATYFFYALTKLKSKTTLLFVPAVIVGIYSGYLAITPTIEVYNNIYTVSERGFPLGEDLDADGIAASKLCTFKDQKVEVNSRFFKCLSVSTKKESTRLTSVGSLAVNQIVILPEKQEVNQVGAASKIEKLSCPWDESSQSGKYACLAIRAPYTTFTFLFRPLPFIDTTSASSFLAGIENLFWISMFGLITVNIIKRKRVDFIEEIAPSLVFFVLYSVGAGAYEGNLGTAFRHKAMILWVVLLLIFTASVNLIDRQKNPKN
jgi:hypothetical protein